MVYRMGVGHGMAVGWSSGRAALHSVMAHHSTHLSTPPGYLSEPVIPIWNCARPRFTVGKVPPKSSPGGQVWAVERSRCER
jgi:hypothetical protein